MTRNDLYVLHGELWHIDAHYKDDFLATLVYPKPPRPTFRYFWNCQSDLFTRPSSALLKAHRADKKRTPKTH